jgi:hypothetical protein
MPSIRLADIPNAGPQSLSASNVGIAAPSVPRFAVNPEAAKLTGAAMVDSSMVTRGARSMLDQSLELNAFSQEAEAAAGFGQSIGKIGEVALAWGDKMARAKDTADLARAETLMRSAFEKQQNDQMNTPVDKWQEKWTANVEQTKKAIGEIGISNNAAQSLSPAFERWGEMSGIQIEGAANKKRIEGYKMDIKANALMKIADEDYEGASAVINQGVKDGTLSAEEGKLENAMMKDNAVRKFEEQRNANIASKIIQNPVEAERDLAEALNSGESKIFGLKEKSDIVRFHGLASSELSQYKSRLDDDALDMVLTGKLKTEKDVRDFVGDALPEQRVQSFLKALSETPIQREKALSMRPMVYAKADSYNPDNDDENESEYLRIRDTIFLLPSDQREEPLAMLRKRRDEKADLTPLNVAKGQMKDLFDAGQFGSWKVGDDKKPLNEEEWNKYIDAGRKYAGHKSSLENWAKNNPREASDTNKVYEQFNRNLTYERQLQKIRQEKDRYMKRSNGMWWEEVAAPVALPPIPIEPDEVLRKIKAKSSLTPKATQKQIKDEVQKIDFETDLPEMSGVTS